MGIDDVLRLGHLTLAVDQLSDRPKTCTALLDYMAPEMLSVKPHNEHELALGLLDDSSSSEAGDEEEDGPSQQQQQQQQQNAGLQRSSGPGDKQTAAAAIDQDSSNGGAPQQPSRQGSRSIPVLQDAGNEAAAAQQGSRRSSNLMRSSRSLNAAAAAGRAEWEHRWAAAETACVHDESLCVVHYQNHNAGVIRQRQRYKHATGATRSATLWLHNAVLPAVMLFQVW
jgi:hypothetical protein